MRKLSALLIASTFALGAANVAHAADDGQKQVTKSEHNHPHKGPRGMMHDPMFKNLNLTDAQKQQIKTIVKENRQQHKKPSDENRQAMHQLVISDNFDKSKAQSLIAQDSQEHQARMLSRLETSNKIYHILTAEQKKQFNDNFAKRIAAEKTMSDKMPRGE